MKSARYNIMPWVDLPDDLTGFIACDVRMFIDIDNGEVSRVKIESQYPENVVYMVGDENCRDATLRESLAMQKIAANNTWPSWDMD